MEKLPGDRQLSFLSNMLIGFIQQGPKSVIPRSGATWESPGTASVIAAFYQEIATPYGLAMTNSEACCVKPISICQKMGLTNQNAPCMMFLVSYR